MFTSLSHIDVSDNDLPDKLCLCTRVPHIPALKNESSSLNVICPICVLQQLGRDRMNRRVRSNLSSRVWISWFQFCHQELTSELPVKSRCPARRGCCQCRPDDHKRVLKKADQLKPLLKKAGKKDLAKSRARTQ